MLMIVNCKILQQINYMCTQKKRKRNGKRYAKIARKHISISILFVNENKSVYANETQIKRKWNDMQTIKTFKQL